MVRRGKDRGCGVESECAVGRVEEKGRQEGLKKERGGGRALEADAL